MTSDSNTVEKPTSDASSDNPKKLERELKDMISTITGRLTDLHSMKKASSTHNADEDDVAFKVITLAGSNVGVTMRADLDEMPENRVGFSGNQDVMNAYLNSNFQAVNNSVMMGGSCTSEDPGVHLEIVEELNSHSEHHKHRKEKEKKKKKDKSPSKDKQPIVEKSHSDRE